MNNAPESRPDSARPEIAKQLASLKRSGVPTSVLYPAGSSAEADVLPELLIGKVVADALPKYLKE